MVREEKRPLKVFLCHASGDKPPVRELYKRLTAEGVDAWLDQEKLLPGQDWRMEIPRAVREADVVVICLSKKSITKEGYVQKEIRFALDIAEEKPEGTIFLIPARLEDCVVPERLNRWQWVDLYEQNGFIKLLRSLKLRADAVDAAVEPALYVDPDKETERRLEQLYTEGLAAFYTEDWDRACQRFQTILSERPNHKNAAEKLEEAERQRCLSKMYEQASAAVRSEDWGTAIQILEELSKKSADYKDAAQLLGNARKQKQLRELYAEAKALHAAQKWEAVVKVFEQIAVIEPNYPDPNGLLPSAQKEVTELKRLADLNDQYSRALREMDAGNWYEARRLLESVHKSQTGFLETEKLLRKVENEIAKEEEKRKQNDEINTLYEQAHGLLRSKKWRNALDKMEEIRKLDDHFPDADGIAEKAQKELAREELEAERQNKLAALYAEAVKLLKEEKYQEALDKWGEVRAIDPKYPDRQWVARTARRKLGGKPEPTRGPRTKISVGNVSIGWFIFLAAVGFGLARLVGSNLTTVFRIDLPNELIRGMAGALQGLIMALILGMIEREWKWKSLPVFGVFGAVAYPAAVWAFGKAAMLLITSMVFALAPAVSMVLTSVWTKQMMRWQTYGLIFIGWVLAWVIGQSAADYVGLVLYGSAFRWVLRDVLAGASGLWSTVDLLGKEAVSNDDIEDDATSTPGSAKLLLWAFLVFVILRTVWQLINDWLHIWDVPSPTPAQVIILSFLGVCFGAVVAFSLKKVIPGWKWHHSLIVIAGWAFGFGIAIVAISANLNFDAVLMAISGLSMVVAVKLAKPHISPLKITSVLVFWWMAKFSGAMLGNYVVASLGTQYIWGFADGVTILLGLWATLGIFEFASGKLLKPTLITMFGFALGNYIGMIATRTLSLSAHIEFPIQYAFMGFIAGVVMELPSRKWKKILFKGGLLAVTLVIGYLLGTLLPMKYISLRNIIYGAIFGFVFGLSTRRISIILILTILGATIFTISAIHIARMIFSVNVEAIIRGGMIGLVLGFGYAYLTRDMENISLAE
ncbi:MAG: TIR domain-containing protein [Anaerolineae bacterium]|nr:TIR domain-containing protein [Anaerolineae bacterium]